MASLPKKMAFGYVRVSTELQASDGVSLEAQKELIRRWCEFNGYELVDVFVDAGISGKKSGNRPGLQKAINAACEAQAALVFYSLSRLARNAVDAMSFLRRLDKSNADLVSLTEKIDTTGAAGKMIFGILAVIAQWESDAISERTTSALNFLRKKSQRISGTIPFGFDLASDGKTLIENQTQMEARNLIVQLHQQKMSLRRIAQTLNTRKIPSKIGKPWGASSIQSILESHAKHRASAST